MLKKMLPVITLIILIAALLQSQNGCSADEENPLPALALLSGTTEITAQVNGDSVTGTLQPLWGDHYDLNYTLLGYPSETGFTALASSLEPRSWRCSVGRWENGPFYPTNATSDDTDLLKAIEREYYRGGNNMTDANDPLKYDFTYLDNMLSELISLGSEPYLCFDYMPFTLASEQDPGNENNLFAGGNGGLSFSNGIRTSPPADNAVYARVVYNVILHTMGDFAGSTDYNLTYYEVGNEPDLVYLDQAPTNYFWTGTRTDFIDMYNAIAGEVDADSSLDSIKLGAGSFALQAHETTPYFSDDFLSDVETNGTRLDFFSYHSYGDTPEEHYVSMQKVQNILSDHSLTPEVINAEWGRALNGRDGAYDTIAHGLFRAKVLTLMQLFQHRFAHEALFRDPLGVSGLLGLIKTDPIGPKPASDVYLALNKMNDCLNAVNVTIDSGRYMLAGRNSGNTKMVIVFIGDEPGLLGKITINLEVNNDVSWQNQSFTVKRYEVSQTTWAADEGVKLEETTPGLSSTNPIFTDSVTYGPGFRKGRIILWELTLL